MEWCPVGLTFGQMDMPLMWTPAETHDHRLTQPETLISCITWACYFKLHAQGVTYSPGLCIKAGVAQAYMHCPEPGLSRFKAQMRHFSSHHCPPPGLLLLLVFHRTNDGWGYLEMPTRTASSFINHLRSMLYQCQLRGLIFAPLRHPGIVLQRVNMN